MQSSGGGLDSSPRTTERIKGEWSHALLPTALSPAELKGSLIRHCQSFLALKDDPDLVERRWLIDQLSAHLKPDSQARLVVLKGAPGTGKSTFLSTLLEDSFAGLFTSTPTADPGDGKDSKEHVGNGGGGRGVGGSGGLDLGSQAVGKQEREDGKHSSSTEMQHAPPLSVLAFHVCAAEEPSTLDASRFVRSLASMLLCLRATHAEYTQYLKANPQALKALGEKECDKYPDKALVDGILEPLRNCPSLGREVRCLVVDALDESMLGPSPSIASLLVKHLDKFPQWLRVIASARPLDGVLSVCQGTRVALIDMNAEIDAAADVKRYIQGRWSKNEMLRHLVAPAMIDVVALISDYNFPVASRLLGPAQNEQPRTDLLDSFAKDFASRFPDGPTSAKWRAAKLLFEIVVAGTSVSPLTKVALRSVLKLALPGYSDGLLGLEAFLGERMQDEQTYVHVFHPILAHWLVNQQAGFRIDVARGHRLLAASLFLCVAIPGPSRPSRSSLAPTVGIFLGPDLEDSNARGALPAAVAHFQVGGDLQTATVRDFVSHLDRSNCPSDLMSLLLRESDAVRVLHDRGERPLLVAADLRVGRCIPIILELNRQFVQPPAAEPGQTPLQAAILRHDHQSVKSLVSNSDLSAIDYVEFAVRCRDHVAIESLLSGGAQFTLDAWWRVFEVEDKQALQLLQERFVEYLAVITSPEELATVPFVALRYAKLPEALQTIDFARAGCTS